MNKLHTHIDHHFDLYTTLLMGLVTVLTAFFVFCASLWGSTSVANYSKANAKLSEANTTYLEYNGAFIQDDLRELRLISGGLSESEAEQETIEANKHIDELLSEYKEEKAASDAHLLLADSANAQGDTFQLIAVILATILFMFSMSLTVKQAHSRFIFFYFSLAALLATTLSSLALKYPF